MKTLLNTFRITLTFFSFAVIVLTSCEKDDPQPEPATPSTPVAVKKPLFAMVDGNAFDAPVANGQLTSGIVLIDGHTGSKIVALNLRADAAVGSTYTLGVNSDYSLHYSPNNYVTIYSAVSGTITVSKNDIAAKHVEGNFSGTVISADSSSTLTITGGQFNCSYH